MFSRSSHPPKAPLVFHVGITGHRELPAADAATLEARLRALFATVRRAVTESFDPEVHAADLPVLRLISPLAEGSDRIAAHAAKAEGFELQACLPRARETYEEDFADEASRAEFRALLASCTAVLEIADASDRAARAYARGGQIMLDHCDLLVAVWDGAAARGEGGTAEVVERARQAEVPVAWIADAAPHAATLIENDEEAPLADDALQRLVRAAVAGAEDEAGARAQRQYLREGRPKPRGSSPYRRLLAGLVSRPAPRRPEAGAAPLVRPPGEGAGDAGERARGQLDEQYDWADALAIRYGDAYHSAMVVRPLIVFAQTLLLAIALFANTFWRPAGADADREGLVNALAFAGQAMCLVGVIVLAKVTAWRRWHRKYLDYRLLAELLRLARQLHPLGMSFPGLRMPVYQGFSAPWVTRPFRAAVRRLGLPSARLDGPALAGLLRGFGALLERQADYHARNHDRYREISRKLGLAWQALFWCGIAFIVARVGVKWREVTGGAPASAAGPGIRWSIVLNLLVMVVPALGSLLNSWLGMPGFEKLRDSSRVMSEQLGLVRRKADRLLARRTATGAPPYDRVRAVVGEGCALMLGEVTDWRGFKASKGLGVA